MGVIRPGPLTRGGAAVLNDFARQTEANAEALARLRRKSTRTILARVTDFDAATNAYTWHERAIAADGTRYDKPAGRSGSPTYAPAYGIGTGNDSLLTIPADVTMRLATVTTTLGPVYEIQTVCACEGGASGSGGGATVSVSCCPSPILVNLTGTVAVTGGSCPDIDGDTFAFTYSGGAWGASYDIRTGLTLNIIMYCTPGTGWVNQVFFLSATCSIVGGSLTNVTCNGSSATFVYSGTLTGGGACCSGASFTITIA